MLQDPSLNYLVLAASDAILTGDSMAGPPHYEDSIAG